MQEVIEDTIRSLFYNKRIVHGVGALCPLDPRSAARPRFLSS